MRKTSVKVNYLMNVVEGAYEVPKKDEDKVQSYVMSAFREQDHNLPDPKDDGIYLQYSSYFNMKSVLHKSHVIVL